MKSGLRIGGSIVICISLFAVLVVSSRFLIPLNGDVVSGTSRVLGGIALVALVAVLFFTTQYWAKWLVGFLGYGLLRFFGGLFVGPYLKPPVSRLEIAGWIVYLLIAILLTARHMQRSPRGTERFGLIGFVLSAPFALNLNSDKPLLCGLLILSVGEFTERFLRREHENTRRNDKPIVPE